VFEVAYKNQLQVFRQWGHLLPRPDCRGTQETTVVIHPLADDRRVLPMQKLDEVIEAGLQFCMAVSCNPGYQSLLKGLKQRTRQRFVVPLPLRT
jgi:hypothetical protein